MRHCAKTSLWLTAATLLLAGCQETGSQRVQVRPPAVAPAPAAASLNVRQPLPLPERLPYTTSLANYARPRVDVLVERVKASLEEGEREYRAGDTEGAAARFQSAVDLMVTNGFQTDSDPRLAALFDRLGEEGRLVNLAGEAESAEDTETPGEPAAIDEIADATLPESDPGLAAKAQRELMGVPHDLPLAVNDSVLQYLSFFTTPRGKAIVEHGLARAGRYRDMIERVLDQEGVPKDLIYLAQAESAFQPRAVSRAGARGIWQFMPFRGEQYDLERNYWMDERSDPEKATRAAARHLRDLYAMFGDWYLVMAAYNSGPLNVIKAVEHTGYADFWELQKRGVLPKQTQNYVPIIVALALVAKEPALYGIEVDAEKPSETDVVPLQHPVSLRLAADATGADLDELQQLNPQLVRDRTPSQAGFELRLPVGTAKNFEQNIEQVPEDKRTSWRLHTAADGETLAEIARHYRVTLPALESANHLDARATVPAGFLLNVPTAPLVARLVRYRVRRGDTLDGIAGRFEVSVADLKRWNHIRGEQAPRGAQLRIYAGGFTAEDSRGQTKSAQNRGASVKGASAHASQETEKLEYRVKPGETLYSIARRYQTTVGALRQSNPFLANRSLQAGDVLAIQR